MNHRGSSFLVALSVTLLVPATVARGQEVLRVLSARDTLRINAVGSPTLSPDGEGLVEPRHQMDRLRRYAELFGEHVENTPISERQE